MLNNLVKQSLPIDKIETFDGSVSGYNDTSWKYDFLFIDGEHTNWACFRDFIHGKKLLRDDAIIAFHDSSLVYESLRMIQETLSASGVKFIFLRVKASEMSVILLNGFCLIDYGKLFVLEEDLDSYYARCESALLEANIENRYTLFEMLKLPLKRLFRMLPRSIQNQVRSAARRSHTDPALTGHSTH